MTPADYLVHLSNLMLLISYSVRNILWLRWFAVSAAIIQMPYYLSQGTVLWPPVIWGIVFTLINLFQIALIYWQRRPIIMNQEEQTLYDMGFHTIKPREFASLLTIGNWTDFVPGEAFIKDGETTDIITIPITGSAVVSSGNETIGIYRPGHVIGLALALTGNPSHINIIFSEKSRCIVWSINAVHEFLDRKPELRAALRDLVDRDLAAKIEGITANVIKHSQSAKRPNPKF